MTDGSEHCSFGYFKCTYIFIDLLDLQPGLYKSTMRNHFGNNIGIILWDNEPYSTQWETIPNLHMLLCGECRKPYTPQCGFIAPGFPHWEIRADSYHNWWDNQWILNQVGWILWNVASGKHTKNYGTSPFFMGKFTFSIAIFNSYVSLPEGSRHVTQTCLGSQDVVFLQSPNGDPVTNLSESGALG